MARTKLDRLGEALVRRAEELEGFRKEQDVVFQDIARYVIPRKASFTEEVSPGVERNRFVLDSTAPRALELFASFLFSFLSNPASTWFDLLIEIDGTLVDDPAVKTWKDEVVKIMMANFSSRRSMLYQQLHQMYLDLGAFGTAVSFTRLAGKNFLIRNQHLGSVVLMENEDGFIDTTYAWRKLTARQAAQRFGDDLGDKINKDKDKNKKHDFIHAVFPATDKLAEELVPRNVLAGKPGFISAHIAKEDQKIVKIGTFEEFPYLTPRWYRENDSAWGRSPAMTVMPDIRMVNRMTETVLRGAEKLVDPPLVFPDGGLVSPVRMFPGGVTFTEGSVEPRPLIPPGASRIEVGDALMVKKQEAIREGFFVPLFITPDSPVKTATQVLQEVDERNRAASPMLIRIHTELFNPLITRAYNSMSRAGMFPTAPPGIRGEDITIRYLSPIIASQREMDALSLQRAFELVAPWAQVDPAAFDPFDITEITEVIGEATGIPARVLRSKLEAGRVAKARADQQQQAQQQAGIIEGVEAGAKLLTAQKSGS